MRTGNKTEGYWGIPRCVQGIRRRGIGVFLGAYMNKMEGYRDIPRCVQGIRRRGIRAFLGAYRE